MELLDDMNCEKENSKELEFHKSRTMFYLNECNIPVFPNKSDEDLSHSDWFNIIGVNIHTTIRGYVKDNCAHLYVGENFSVPVISVTDLAFLLVYFNIDTIKLGCKIGEIGTPWKCYYEFKEIK